MKPINRCTRCILPENYPGISFNKKGVCNRCEEWDVEFNQVNYDLLKIKLHEIVEKCKAESEKYSLPYDVIVPLSGGKDSAYVLYLMREVYNCRVLAINYNNTFQTIQAYKNLMSITNTFDVDFKMIGIKPSLLKKAYAEGLKRQGEFCLVCNCSGYWIMLSFLHQYFSKYKYVPMIVGGWSKLFEFDPQINTLDFVQYRQLLEDSDLLAEFSEYLSVEVLDSLTGQSDVRQANSGGFIQLPDYLPWDHKEIIQTLEKRGWQKIKDKDTHFDCWASPIADDLERAKYGLNQKTTILATYARAGKIDRSKALLEEEIACSKKTDASLYADFIKHIEIDKDVLSKHLPAFSE